MSNTMRAWQFSKISNGLENSMHLNDSAPRPPTPTAGSGKLLIEVCSAALNPAEYKIVEIPVIGNYMSKHPAIPGMDYAGRVAESGEGFNKGDRVFGRIGEPQDQAGTLAQYIVAPVKAMGKLPDNVSFEEGACMGTAALSAYQTVKPWLPKDKQSTVFINGSSGGVGTFTVQVAKALGCHVVASCSGANAEMVKKLGADEVIDYRSTDLASELKKQGKRFDLVVDNVGYPYNLHKTCDSIVNDGGRMIQLGAGMGFSAIMAMLNSAMRPRFLGGPRTPWKFIWVDATKPQDMAQLADWAGSGRVKPVVDSVFPFAQANKAYEKLKTGRAKGKVVVSLEK